MLSYRHSFHAGNYADVLKHIVLTQILTHLTQKDKPLCYIDSHAGAGGYSLKSAEANKTGEFHNGIAKLWQQNDMPDVLDQYLASVRQFNDTPSLVKYPGSPWLAGTLLRTQDRLCLHEIHPSDLPTLRQTMRPFKRAKVFAEDGFKGLIGHLPPLERRGLVLIDPPYEMKQDYQLVVDSLKKAHKRFATGCYAVWYPVVDRYRIDEMEQALKESGIKNIQLFELGIAPDSEEFGMTSSGMIVINPPWKLKQEMETVIPWLAETLSTEHDKLYRIEQLVEE